ncbi:10727_t:CDS:2, partial [Scutellospora calospora]
MLNEFLHCNACFAYLTSSTSSTTRETQIRFWLTECGHVICQSCLNKHGDTTQDNSSTATEPICPVCNTKCAAVELTDQLPPNLSMFFRPAHEIIEETADILRFQQTNTFSLLKFLKDKVAKQKQMLDKAKNELLQYKDTKNQLQAIKKENQRLKAQIQDVRSSIAANETTESPSKLSTRHVSQGPDSNSPVQHGYYNYNTDGFISDNQSLWNRGDGNYEVLNGEGVMPSQN